MNLVGALPTRDVTLSPEYFEVEDPQSDSLVKHIFTVSLRISLQRVTS